MGSRSPDAAGARDARNGLRQANWGAVWLVMLAVGGPLGLDRSPLGGALWAAPPPGRTAPPGGSSVRTRPPVGRGLGLPSQLGNSPANLAVDVVEVTDGPPLRGLLLQRTSRGDLVLVAEREWLRKAHPDLLRNLTEAERRGQPLVARELLDRLRAWRAEPALPDRLQSFLDAELRRGEAVLERWTAGPEEADVPPFVWVDLPAAKVRRWREAPARNRQIALLAWRENLAGVCTKTVPELDGELRQLGFQPESERINLADRLPLRRQSEREWQARRAILAYNQQQPLDFQGTATRLLRTGPEAPPANVAELLAEAWQAQLSQTVSDLLNPEAGATGARTPPFAVGALAKCRRLAQQLQLRGYRATAVRLDPVAGQSRVDSRFEVQLGPEEWVVVWQATRRPGSERATPAARQRLREDPQVRQVLDLLSQAGLAGDNAVDQALEVGLATQQMQQELDAEFGLFVGHYGLHAEGPPLFLPEPAGP